MQYIGVSYIYVAGVDVLLLSQSLSVSWFLCALCLCLS